MEKQWRKTVSTPRAQNIGFPEQKHQSVHYDLNPARHM